VASRGGPPALGPMPPLTGLGAFWGAFCSHGCRPGPQDVAAYAARSGLEPLKLTPVGRNPRNPVPHPAFGTLPPAATEGAWGRGCIRHPRLTSLCENLLRSVIPIRQPTERNLALSIFEAVQDSSSSATKNGGLLGMTFKPGFHTDSHADGLNSPAPHGPSKTLSPYGAPSPNLHPSTSP
jgi:hypothetical protein